MSDVIDYQCQPPLIRHNRLSMLPFCSHNRLMLAAYAGKLEIVKELRHYNARYDLVDRGGSSALHWAVDGKRLDLIEWMLDDGASLDASDHNGWTPLLRNCECLRGCECLQRARCPTANSVETNPLNIIIHSCT